jgi:iron complex transport system permease protein
MERWRRTVAWSAGLTALLAVACVVAIAHGSVAIDPLTAAKALCNAIVVPTVSTAGTATRLPPVGQIPWIAVRIDLVHPFAFPVGRSDQLIVTKLRAPRVALAAVVGFALATAGTVMQGFFRNPMADPSIIGVSAGAATGAVASIVFPRLLPLGLQGAAFLGALIVAFGVYLIATENGRTPVATLLLAGVAVQTFLGAIVSYMLLLAGDSLERALYWLMGHLSAAAWSDVAVTLPPVLLGFALLAAYARDLNILLLGEEDAYALGVDAERTKRILLAVSSLVTAAAVAVAGVIGFVGLVVPHVLRLLVGPDHRILLPTSALAGAVFLVATDAVARSGPAELPVGIVTAALGAPFFLYLLRRREVHAL